MNVHEINAEAFKRGCGGAIPKTAFVSAVKVDERMWFGFNNGLPFPNVISQEYFCNVPATLEQAQAALDALR